MGAYEKSTDVNQIAAVYEKYRENPETPKANTSGGAPYGATWEEMFELKPADYIPCVL